MWDWMTYRVVHMRGQGEDKVITTIFMERDARFRRQARAAISCYDEAGLGSGPNSLRLIMENKPILGCYNPGVKDYRVNLHHILQLGSEFPRLVTLVGYGTIAAIRPKLLAWLQEVAAWAR
jgi:hypothetical protein